MPEPHPVALREALIKLVSQGVEQTEAARRVGIHRRTAEDIVRRWRETGSFLPGGHARYAFEDRQRLIDLVSQGDSVREAARLSGIRLDAARQIVRLWRETGSFLRADAVSGVCRRTRRFRWKRCPSAPGQAKPSHKFGPFLDEWLHKSIAGKPNITVNELQRRLTSLDIKLHNQTISFRLRVLGYRAEALQS